MRLIDADALKKKAFGKRGGLLHTSDVDEAPTIDAMERKKGEWIDYSGEGYVECPYCHSATNCDGNKEELHFCFSCGADMRGEEHE